MFDIVYCKFSKLDYRDIIMYCQPPMLSRGLRSQRGICTFSKRRKNIQIFIFLSNVRHLLFLADIQFCIGGLSTNLISLLAKKNSASIAKSEIGKVL